MNSTFSKALKVIIPLVVGLFLIWYSLSSITAEERLLLWTQIKSANPYWLLLSIVIALISHLSRAYKWKFMLETLGYKTSLGVRFSSIMIGYVANLGIPRSGELLRAVTVSKYENIPVQKVIGTVITERLLDLVMLIIVMFVTFLCNTDILLGYLEQQNINPLKTVLTLLFLLLVLVIGYYILDKIKFSFLKKIKLFVKDIYEGVLSIFKIKSKKTFIFHTIFIWFAYIGMFFVIKYCVPGTMHLSFSAILMAFVAGSFAISTTNGGIGAYPLAIGLVLSIFSISKFDGEAYGWILWGSQTLMNIVVGGISYAYLVLFKKK